mmetsp:Transcript_43079/g.100952  ORF Transcript_43079/g.100952 Transcript_43079/m.100952 type:complete len:269 (-) Transcript_43079:48-854(-)
MDKKNSQAQAEQAQNPVRLNGNTQAHRLANCTPHDLSHSKSWTGRMSRLWLAVNQSALKLRPPISKTCGISVRSAALRSVIPSLLPSSNLPSVTESISTARRQLDALEVFVQTARRGCVCCTCLVLGSGVELVKICHEHLVPLRLLDSLRGYLAIDLEGHSEQVPSRLKLRVCSIVVEEGSLAHGRSGIDSRAKSLKFCHCGIDPTVIAQLCARNGSGLACCGPSTCRRASRADAGKCQACALSQCSTATAAICSHALKRKQAASHRT